MDDLKIYSAIKSYEESKPVRLHMPGHKGKNVSGLSFYSGYDVTELPALDIENVLSSAEEDIAKIMGAKKCHILTDGSSAGVLSMIYGIKDVGRQLIIFRSSHKSVYNGLTLAGIEPIIIEDDTENVLSEVKKAVSENPETIGALLTYPDYYGRVFDIEKVSEFLKSKGKLLLIDGAHGSHFKFTGYPVYAGEFADAWVDGVHKTNVTFNQGALLLINNVFLERRLLSAADIFSTTSPSYIIAASVEYGVKFLNDNKDGKLKKFCAAKQRTDDEIKALGYVLSHTDDPMKTVIDFYSSGYDSGKANAFLEKNGVFAEMNDGKNTVFMFSVSNSVKDLKRFILALKLLKQAEGVSATPLADGKRIKCERVLPYLSAVNAEYEYTPIEESADRICAENFGVLPPCSPIVVAGEKINEEAINEVKSGKYVFGIKDGKVKTVKIRG